MNQGYNCDRNNLLCVFCVCTYHFVSSEAGNVTPVRERDSPAVPRLRSVNSYTNIRAASSARNLNKSLQNLNLNEEGELKTVIIIVFYVSSQVCCIIIFCLLVCGCLCPLVFLCTCPCVFALVCLCVCISLCVSVYVSLCLCVCARVCLPVCVCCTGGPVTFSPGNLSASSSASSTLGSPDNDEYLLSFETIDKMRRVSSYSSLNSLIGETTVLCPDRSEDVD